VDLEIKRLEGIGIVQNTEYSPWRTPLVPVVKSGGPKFTVNPQGNEDTLQGLEGVVEDHVTQGATLQQNQDHLYAVLSLRGRAVQTPDSTLQEGPQ
jgi:hypothetical protein